MQFILFLLFISSIINCQKDDRKYYFNEVDGYIRISKETADFLVDKMKLPIKSQSMDYYDFIFQKFPLDTLWKIPYMRVYINENGRLTKSELKEYGKKYYTYDAYTNYLWQEKNDQLNAIIPTSLGSINIYCYSTKENYQIDKESFKKFINSIMLFPDVKYRESIIRDIPLFNDMFYEGKHLSTIIVFILLIIIYLARKKNKRVVT